MSRPTLSPKPFERYWNGEWAGRSARQLNYVGSPAVIREQARPGLETRRGMRRRMIWKGEASRRVPGRPGKQPPGIADPGHRTSARARTMSRSLALALLNGGAAT